MTEHRACKHVQHLSYNQGQALALANVTQVSEFTIDFHSILRLQEIQKRGGGCIHQIT